MGPLTPPLWFLWGFFLVVGSFIVWLVKQFVERKFFNGHVNFYAGKEKRAGSSFTLGDLKLTEIMKLFQQFLATQGRIAASMEKQVGISTEMKVDIAEMKDTLSDVEKQIKHEVDSNDRDREENK